MCGCILTHTQSSSLSGQCKPRTARPFYIHTYVCSLTRDAYRLHIYLFIYRHIYIYMCAYIITHTQSSLLRGQYVPRTARSFYIHTYVCPWTRDAYRLHIYLFIYRHIYIYICVCVCAYIITHTQSSLLRGQSLPRAGSSVCVHTYGWPFTRDAYIFKMYIHI